MTDQMDQARVSLLYRELRWLMRLRWLAAALIVLVGCLDLAWGSDAGRGGLFVGVGAALAMINAALLTVNRRLPRLHQQWGLLLTLATAHLAVDLGSLTVLVLHTGGVESPLIGLYIVHMVFLSLLQPRTRAYVAAGLTLAVLAAGLWLTHQWPSGPASLLRAAGWLVTAAATVYVANRITDAVYRREMARARQNRRLRTLMERVRAQQAVLMQQDKLAAMGQLAAGVAHEIANPLASMDSVLQLIQRNPSTPRPEMVSAMREHIARIDRTVRQLTTFAHPGEGGMESVEVNVVVMSAMNLLSFDRRLRRVEVERDLDPGAGSTWMNTHAMEQVLSNLLRNALDAMDDTPSPRLVVRTARQDGECLIEVLDNGSGIDENHAARVFEPFFTTKPVGRGTGLGLSISAKLVRDQGGHITVSSQPGKGARFTIHLPAGEGAAREGRLTAPSGSHTSTAASTSTSSAARRGVPGTTGSLS